MQPAPPTYRSRSSSSLACGSPLHWRASREIVEHPRREINEPRLRRLARTGPVAACDEKERAFETARLENSLHLLADGAAYVVDAAAVERAHDGRRRQLEARPALGLHRLAQSGVREIHVGVQVVFARCVCKVENTEDESRHGSPTPKPRAV